MADSHDEGEPVVLGPGDQEFIFKGHSQPSVNDRLRDSNIYLADEDIDRGWKFDERRKQIEEFVEYIQKENIPHDAKLLKDVNIKLRIHRDWEKTRTGPQESLCCDAPTIKPFSTRLMNAKISTAYQEGMEEMGNNQVRKDGPVFTIDPSVDHEEFLEAFKKDSQVDPELMNSDNLFHKEAVAYQLALKDPAMIPYWLHPTKGLPRTGVTVADVSWYNQKPEPAEAAKNRPARGWVPSYLLKVEHKINSLLEQDWATDSYKYQKLIQLLRFVEPQDVHLSRLQWESFDDMRPLGALRLDLKQEKNDLKLKYWEAENAWLRSLGESGVYFIIEQPDQIPVNQPGVFYVLDGIMSEEQQETLNLSQELLQRTLQDSRDSLTEQEGILLDGFLQSSLPSEILEIQEDQVSILKKAGAHNWHDLSNQDRAAWNSLDLKARELQDEWELLLTEKGAEFRYFRPGEIRVDDGTVLYLPWHMTSVASFRALATKDLQLPEGVQVLQDIINHDLKEGDRSVPKFEDAVQEVYISQLLNVVYPELRILLEPFLVLRQEKRTRALTEKEESWYTKIEEVAIHDWGVWYTGLGKRITIKMPKLEQQDENPSLLYLRTPYMGEEDMEVFFKRKAVEITQELATGQNSTEWYLKILDLLMEYQYPALRKLYDQFFRLADQSSPLGPDNNQKRQLLEGEWGNKFRAWVNTKRNRIISIKMFNANIDPEDDPSVVYFRDMQEHFQQADSPATDAIKRHFRARKALNQPFNNVPEELVKDFPYVVRAAFALFKRSGSDVHKAAYEWHLDSWLKKSGPQIPSSFNLPGQPLSPPDTVASFGGTQMPTSPRSPRTAFSDFTSHPINPPIPSSPVLSRSPRMRGFSNLTDIAGRREQNLGVDLNTKLPEIMAIEKKLNRLLAEKRACEKAGTPFDLELHTELADLLTQFVPLDMYKDKLAVDRIAKEIQDTNDKRKPPLWTRRDLRVLSLKYERQFQGWVRSLAETPVRIAIPGSKKKQYGESLLYFNYWITGTGNEFKITIPVEKSQDLTSPVSPNFNKIQDLYAQHRNDLKDSENTINGLLSKYHQDPELEWHDSEMLLSHLRRVMPLDLQELDRELTALDNKARDSTKQLTDEESLRWHELWEIWNELYKEWVDSLPRTGIRIGKKDRRRRYDEATLELQVDTWNNAFTKRSQSLPAPVKKRQDDLNNIFSGYKKLDHSSIGLLKSLLQGYHQPMSGKFRKKLQSFLTKFVCAQKLRDSEDKIIIESSLEQEFLIWTKDLIESRGTSVQMEEKTPGSFEVHLRISGVLQTKEKEESENVVDEIWSRLCPDFLMPSKKKFHDQVSNIRDGTSLSDGELSEVQEVIRSLPINGMLPLLETIFQLTKKNKQQGLNEVERAELINADLQWLWSELSRQFPEFREILSIDPAKNLLSARLSSDDVNTSPPTIPPPNGFQLTLLQTEVNNLLFKYKSKTLSKDENVVLQYLIRALLPRGLKFLSKRIDYLLSARVTSDQRLAFKLEMNLVETQRVFESRLREHLLDLSSRPGIFLDTYWYSVADLTEVWSRVEQLKLIDVREDKKVAFPYTGKKLLNTGSLKIHDVYTVLKRFVDRGCAIAAEEDDAMLLLKKEPDDLVLLREQIRNHPANRVDVTESTVVAELRVLKEEFIKLFMKWYTSLSEEELSRLKVEYAKNLDINIDFSGKAERRGIQRAADEIALNNFATNQEQHRPHERFREVDLKPHMYEPPPQETPLALPLPPTKRLIEQDTFEYTKKMQAYRQSQDNEFKLALKESRKENIEILPTPQNFNGPFPIAKTLDMRAAAKKKSKQLVTIANDITAAERKAPRPLLQQLLLRFAEGFADSKIFLEDGETSNPRYHTHELYDDEEIKPSGIEILKELAQPSWDEEQILDPDEIEDYPTDEAEKDALEDFELDVQQVFGLGPFSDNLDGCWILPPWTPDADYEHEILDENDDENCKQCKHDHDIPSTVGLSVEEIEGLINNYRLEGNRAPWSLEDLVRYLRIMRNGNKIHFDEDLNRVSMIPLSGHPENKYIISAHKIYRFPGVQEVSPGEYEVQYDAEGTMGRPILQPNKYDYLQRLTFRLGRDAMTNIVIGSKEHFPSAKCLEQQHQAYEEVAKFLPIILRGSDKTRPTLKQLALDLLDRAPDLIEDNLPNLDPEEMTEQEAASILQLQIIEELNNNWEPRFPENEHVWDFATPRLAPITRNIAGHGYQLKPRPRQYFSMRRFPVECQIEAMRTKIKESGPTVLKIEEVERPETYVVPMPEERMREREKEEWKLHQPGEPIYTFGETALQAAWLSEQFEQDLKRVPEFQPRPRKKTPTSYFSFLRRDHSRERSPSPEPSSALPTFNIPNKSISQFEKHWRLLEEAQTLPGAPDPNIVEYYYTPAQLKELKKRQEIAKDNYQVWRANKAVKELMGKSFQEATDEEIDDARRRLGIDFYTEKFIGKPQKRKKGDGIDENRWKRRRF